MEASDSEDDPPRQSFSLSQEDLGLFEDTQLAQTPRKRLRKYREVKQSQPAHQTSFSLNFSQEKPSSSTPKNLKEEETEEEETDEELISILCTINNAFMETSDEEEKEQNSQLNEEDLGSFPKEEPSSKLIRRKPLKKRKDPSEPSKEQIEAFKKNLGRTNGLSTCGPSLSSGSFTPKDDSDDEELFSEKTALFLEKFKKFPEPVIKVGTILKLLANVYLGRLDETANIFVPRWKLDLVTPEGEIKEDSDFFYTPKKELCIFASGGLQNVWEKNVAHIYHLFFNKEVKIIRSRWLQNHLFRDKGIRKDFEEEFRERETKLHSEFYYDLFFQHFFLPNLPDILKRYKDVQLVGLTVYAFSWWDVCNGCDEILTKHQLLLNKLNPPAKIQYKIAATRRYKHHYPQGSVVEGARILDFYETKAWELIWGKVSEYVNKSFPSEDEKDTFWTKTKDGLELCKWLGQTFAENVVGPDGRKAIALKRGDILRHYQEITEEDTEGLESLLTYLREKNWELSCWYRHHFPDIIQKKWKKHWHQLVIPHFGWEVVQDFHNESSDDCEMCGYKGIFNTTWIFNSKYRVSKKFLDFSEDEQRLREPLGEGINIPFDELPPVLQQKRKQSLCVGSECVQVLCCTREDIEKWRIDNPDEDIEARWHEMDERMTNDELLEKAEKELKKRQKEKKNKKKETKKRRKKKT